MENAEVESTARFIEGARRMGIEARTFARSEDIYPFEPDFVLAISYQDAKLTPFPTYGLLTMPVGWIKTLPRFVRNVLSYDGYWTVSPSVSQFVAGIHEKAGKSHFGAFAAISYARTEFVPLDFSRAWAAYLGTNWDGQRHGEIFRALAPLGVAKFYGKHDRWSHLPASAFGGEVPFDGVSVLDAYRSAGVGLCLNHPDFDADGSPTSRIFEVPAASAVMIAGRNRLVEDAFGDAALYVDAGGPPEQVAGAIREHVEWVRAHPGRTLEMARTCHRVFSERFALEVFLANALEMHRAASVGLGFAVPTSAVVGSESPFEATVIVSVDDETLPRLGRCLDSIAAQTLAPSRTVIVDQSSVAKATTALQGRSGALVLHLGAAGGPTSLPALLLGVLEKIKTEWVCCISAEEILFPNHLFAAAEAVRRHRARLGRAPTLVYSGMTQISDAAELPELMSDDHKVVRKEHIRIAQFDFDPGSRSPEPFPVHPASCVLRVPTLRASLSPRWLMRWMLDAALLRLRRLTREGDIAFTAAVTLATSRREIYHSFGRFFPPPPQRPRTQP
ncbi:MAG TPA: glycosyltransferase family A protein [Alphaproteobacteria bacterium]